MTITSRLEAHLDSRYSPHTRRMFLGTTKRFIATVGLKESYDRDDVLAYVDGLIRAGYKEQSIKTLLQAVRTFFDAEGWAWPLKGHDLRLGLPQEEPNGPALLPSDVRLLIAAVKGQKGFPATVVCLASVFGLRGDEIARTLAAGCDGRTLVIQTAKGGRKRSHLIPGVIGRHLTFGPLAVSPRRLHREFESLMSAHARPQLPREGWHSFRRTLITELYEAGLTTFQIHRWMGWKELKDISYRYYKPSAPTLDKAIYDAHPFLRDWRTP